MTCWGMVNSIVWYLSYCVPMRFLFSTNIKTCFSNDSKMPSNGVNMAIVQDVVQGNKKLVWNLSMKNIFEQLDTSSNEFVIIFFAKVGSENHHIPIFILMWGSSTICVAHPSHTQSLHVISIVLLSNKLD
jgi:hypothetical protein